MHAVCRRTAWWFRQHPLRLGGKENIQKLENLGTSIRAFARYFHPCTSPTHQTDFFMDWNVLYFLCIHSAKHSAQHISTQQPLRNIYPKEHMGHISDDSKALSLVCWEKDVATERELTL